MSLKCILKLLTGFDCPFCGAQRAFDALIHGDIPAVWYYNPFLVTISPYLLMVILAVFKIIPPGSRLQKLLYHRYVIIAAGILTVAWWIFRNTAFYLSLK